ncbi:MAG: hypothetical protein WCI94_09215 [Rhodospirillales bacterium]
MIQTSGQRDWQREFNRCAFGNFEPTEDVGPGKKYKALRFPTGGVE